MKKRYCTLPKIPWFRKWFEGKFGDLCKIHDDDYAAINDSDASESDKKQMKILTDFRFAQCIAIRGHVFLAIGALMFFQLPWVGK